MIKFFGFAKQTPDVVLKEKLVGNSRLRLLPYPPLHSAIP